MTSLPPTIDIDEPKTPSQAETIAVNTLEKLAEMDTPSPDKVEALSLEGFEILSDLDDSDDHVSNLFESTKPPLQKEADETDPVIRALAKEGSKNRVDMPILLEPHQDSFHSGKMILLAIAIVASLVLLALLLKDMGHKPPSTVASIAPASEIATPSPELVAEVGPIDDFAIMKGMAPDIHLDPIEMNPAPAVFDNGYDKSKCENLKTRTDWLECNRAVYAGVRVEMKEQRRQISHLEEIKALQEKEIATLQSQKFSFAALPWWQRSLLTFMLLSSVLFLAGILGWIRGLKKNKESGDSAP